MCVCVCARYNKPGYIVYIVTYILGSIKCTLQSITKKFIAC